MIRFSKVLNMAHLRNAFLSFIKLPQDFHSVHMCGRGCVKSPSSQENFQTHKCLFSERLAYPDASIEPIFSKALSLPNEKYLPTCYIQGGSVTPYHQVTQPALIICLMPSQDHFWFFLIQTKCCTIRYYNKCDIIKLKPFWRKGRIEQLTYYKTWEKKLWKSGRQRWDFLDSLLEPNLLN